MMMEVKFICTDVTRGMQSGFYDAQEDDTVANIFANCEQINGVTISESTRKMLHFLLDGSYANWDTPLAGKKILTVMRTLYGG